MKNKKVILLIEDDESISEVLTIILEKNGFSVIQDLVGTYALKKDMHIDLAIVDYLLPNTTGEEIIKSMKKKSEYKNTKIVLMSANPEDRLREIASKLHINAIISKPFNIDDITKKVHDLLR